MIAALNSTPVLFALTSAVALLAGTSASVSRHTRKRTKKGKVIDMSFTQGFRGRPAAAAALATINSLVVMGVAATG